MALTLAQKLLPQIQQAVQANPGLDIRWYVGTLLGVDRGILSDLPDEPGGGDINAAVNYWQTQGYPKVAAAAEGSPQSVAEVVQRYKAGQYGAVGSPEARKAATVDLANIWMTTGLPRDEAFARATHDWYQTMGLTVVPTETPSKTPVPTSVIPTQPPVATATPKTGGTVPVIGEAGAQTQEEFEASQSATEAGRRDLFNRFTAGYLPEGTSGYLRNAVARQFQALSNAYLQGLGLGDIQAGHGFSDFLGNNIRGGVSPEQQQALLGRTQALLGQPFGTGTDTQRSYREALAKNPFSQFTLAQEAGRSGVARPFEQSYKDLAARNFQAYGLASGLGHLGLGAKNQNFLDFANQGGILGQTAPNVFRNFASQAGNLLTNPDVEGLAPELQTFRTQLLEDPEEQFALALQASLEDVAAPFRSGYGQIAKRAFQRYPVGAENPFLSFAAKRGFRF